ncbi:MAG TPA: hypothetical protein VHH92_02800 [Actinomycetota bacterium]|nr:hypothetical protein [Actinomycetota bacterium]
MDLLLGVGVPVKWARGGPIDVVPLLASVAAVLITRFVIGVRLTPVTVILAVTGGSAWAWAIAVWGIELPTLIAIVVVLLAKLMAAPARAA